MRRATVGVPRFCIQINEFAFRDSEHEKQKMTMSRLRLLCFRLKNVMKRIDCLSSMSHMHKNSLFYL